MTTPVWHAEATYALEVMTNATFAMAEHVPEESMAGATGAETRCATGTRMAMECVA